jgi:hypothetical protein
VYKELHQQSENLVSDLRKQIKIAEAQREDALSSQTQLAIEIQNLKIEVKPKNFLNYFHYQII